MVGLADERDPKMENKKTKKTSRHGRHKESKVMLGGMVEPKWKAITIVTAAAFAGRGKPITQSDLLLEGVCRLAYQVGVMDANGEITEQYRDAVELAELTIVDQLNIKRSKK